MRCSKRQQHIVPKCTVLIRLSVLFCMVNTVTDTVTNPTLQYSALAAGLRNNHLQLLLELHSNCSDTWFLGVDRKKVAQRGDSHIMSH